MDQKKTKIVILGAGESGIGSAILARKKGFDVFVSDRSKIKEKYKNVLLQNEIEFEEEKHTLNLINQASEIIKSPGIPDNIPFLLELKKKGVPIISEIEFAGRYTEAFIIGITGSNGKTTTTLLTYHILKSAGLNVGLAGNIGQSFAWQVAEKSYDYYVLELSSFQLDGINRFKSNIAVLLNITPDHLDRYNYQFENYAASKFKITDNQSGSDAFVYCADDEVIQQLLSNSVPKSRLYPFSIKQKMNREGAYSDGKKIEINIHTNKINMTLEELALQGKHNVYNSMAAGISAKLVGIRKETIKKCLADFQNVEHRLEFVASISGIEFVNDSKATNVNSTWYALESMQNKVVWIAGGIDKGNDYEILRQMVREKVKAIICLGIDNAKIHDAFSGDVETIVDVQSASEAVNMAYSLAESGDSVLLSPACASFDLFENYEDRGHQFKAAVNSL